MKAELVLDCRCGLGEGPVWDEGEGWLYWVDILAGRVHRWRPGTDQVETAEAGEPVGAAALRRGGGLVLALKTGFALAETFGGGLERLATYADAAPDLRMNDGKCDPAGRFWAGTMAMDFREGAGALYRLDADGSVTRVLEGVTISNGMDWTEDGSRMYYIDSPRRTIDAFDFDAESGRISGRRTVAAIPEEAGLPDGMTLDDEGRIWVALWGGGAVWCYSPEGRLLEVIEVPASQTTSCCFGGRDLGVLFITSARDGLSREQLQREPEAGGIFAVRCGARGRAARRFAG
ncbi:MAG: SMP-30/gluconolactonase/LRE family protein [Bryobacteraceae bacterium]